MTAGVDGELINIRGRASPEELAAVLTVVTGRPQPTVEDALQRWRRQRQQVTRPTR